LKSSSSSSSGTEGATALAIFRRPLNLESSSQVAIGLEPRHRQYSGLYVSAKWSSVVFRLAM